MYVSKETLNPTGILSSMKIIPWKVNKYHLANLFYRFEDNIF